MAKNKVKVIVEGDTRPAEKELKRFSKKLNKMGSLAERALGFAAGGALLQLPGMLMDAGRAVSDFIHEGAEIDNIAKAFEGLNENADEALSRLREGALGMITDTELMRTYNEAAQLVGQTFADRLPSAMGHLSKVAAATGKDMDFMLNSLVTGVGRLSPMILDNLGITVDLNKAYEDYAESIGKNVEELTKQEQQTALMNQALELLAENTAEMPDIQDSAAASLARVKVQFANLKDTASRALMPALEQVLGVFSNMIEEHGPKLQEIIKQAGEQFAVWVRDVLPQVVAWFRDELVPTIRDQVIPAALEIIAWIRDQAIPWIRDKLIPAIKDMIDWFTAVWNKFNETKDQLTTTIEQIKFIFENLWLYLQIKWNDFMNRVRGWAEDFKRAGHDIVEGLRRGVEAAWEGFKAWLYGKFMDLINSVKSALGIGSPSKIFAGIGEDMMTGLAAGIAGGIDMPVTASVMAGGAAVQGARAGIVNNYDYNLTIHSQATTEDVQSSYDIMRAMAGA